MDAQLVPLQGWRNRRVTRQGMVRVGLFWMDHVGPWVGVTTTLI
jgi:hypothetical protein